MIINLRDLVEKMSIEFLSSLISDELNEYIDNNKANKNNICNYVINNIDFFSKDNCFLDEINRISHDFYGLSLDSKDLLKLSGYSSHNSNNSDNIFLPAISYRFYELLDYQTFMKYKIINYLETTREKGNSLIRFIVHMPTGTGKTKTIVHTIYSLYSNEKFKGTILWLAHTNELLDQAVATFRNVFGVLCPIPLNYYKNDFRFCSGEKEIIFSSYAKVISFYKHDKASFINFRKNVTYIVCDEAHKAVAKETSLVLSELMTKFDLDMDKTLIGLTATPGRKFNDYLNNDENELLSIFFDKKIFSVVPSDFTVLNNYNFDKDINQVIDKDDKVIDFFQKRKVLATLKKEYLEYDYQETVKIQNILSSKSAFNPSTISFIGKSKKRNEAILERLISLNKGKIPTIFFACSNEHGKLISDLLTLNGVPNHGVFDDTNPQLREKYIKSFENSEYYILINNMILSTGFDSPNIKCVFISKPTNSIVLYSQMIGRGLRGPLMGGNAYCLLIDLKDNTQKFGEINFAYNYFNDYWR